MLNPCFQEECDCEGRMEVSQELEGRVLATYMDPLTDYETDLEPRIVFPKTGGWKKARLEEISVF